MLGDRFRIDDHPRLKNGRAAQSTIGVARINSIQIAVRCPTQSRTGMPTISPIASMMSGTAAAELIHMRRVKSTNSPLGSSEGTIGSSAMPQIGHSPGASRTISGCIGQVYCEPATAISS